MTKKGKRIIGAICLAIMLVSVLAVGVSAACTKGYSNYVDLSRSVQSKNTQKIITAYF